MEGVYQSNSIAVVASILIDTEIEPIGTIAVSPATILNPVRIKANPVRVQTNALDTKLCFEDYTLHSLGSKALAADTCFRSFDIPQAKTYLTTFEVEHLMAPSRCGAIMLL